MKVLLRIRVPEFDKTKCESRVKNILLFVFILYQDEADIIYSLSTGDVHFCGNVKGIKDVSCPSKFYGLAAAGKPVLGIWRKVQRCLIEEIGGGLVVEAGIIQVWKTRFDGLVR